MRPSDVQRSEEQCIRDAEDGGVGADADRERQHGREGEGRTARHHPKGVTHVATEIFEPARAAGVARLFFDGLEAAEARKRPTPGVVVGHAVGDEPPRLFAYVVAKLRVELALQTIATKQTNQPAHVLLRLKNQLNGFGLPAPIGDFAFKSRPARSCQSIDLRGSAGVRFRPRRREQTAILEPMQRGIERALRHLEQGARHVADALRNRIAVERLAREHLQNEHVQGALEQIEVRGGRGCHA